MATRYIRIKVGGSVVHAEGAKRCINFAYTKTYGDSVSTAEIVLKRTNTTEDDAYFVSGQAVQVWVADTLVASGKTQVDETSANIIFSGYVDDRSIDHAQITLRCGDRLILAKWSEKAAYEWADNTDPATIFTDLLGFVFVTTYRPALAATVNGATGTTFAKYVLENDNIYEKLWEIANIINWQFYYDPATDKVIFEPRGNPTAQNYYNKAAGSARSDQSGATNPTTWTGKTINVLGLIKWDSNSSELVNNINGYGGQLEITRTETKALVGTLYTINGAATSTHPYNVTVTASDAYVFTQGTEYVVVNNGIAFLDFTAIVAPHMPGSIDILYTFKKQASTSAQNATDVTSKTSYVQRDKTLFKRNIVDTNDIQAYVTNLLGGFKGPITDTTFEVKTTVTTPVIGAPVSVYDGIVGRYITSGKSPVPIIIKTVETWPRPTTTTSISTRPLKYEDSSHTTYDRVAKTDKELNKTNSLPFFKLDGSTPVNEDMQFGAGAQLKVPVIHNLAGDPYGGVAGQMYYNTTSGKMYYYDGSGKAWVEWAIGGVGTPTNIIVGSGCGGSVTQPTVEASPSGTPCDILVTVGKGGRIRITESA